MPKNIVQAATGRTQSTAADPVVEIGRKLGEAYRRDEELSRKECEAGRANNLMYQSYYDNAQKHEWDKVDILRDLMSTAQATTLDGAALQIAHALGVFDALWDQVPSEIETYGMKRECRALVRLLYSALNAVEARADRKATEIVWEHFNAPYLNVWTPVEDRLAAAVPSADAGR